MTSVNMGTSASLSWLSLRPCPPNPPPPVAVPGGVGPHPSLLLSRTFTGGLPAVFGLLSWLFSSLPAPVTLLPPCIWEPGEGTKEGNRSFAFLAIWGRCVVQAA